MSKPRPYFIATVSTLFLFTAFAMLWFYACNRYGVLHYHEQIQLFRFDWLYFRSYLGRPGGLAEYLGTFLTQFYVCPVAGSVIIASILAGVALFFGSVCRACGSIERLFFIPFVPAVLLLMSFVNINFDMSAALGLLLTLAAFRWYLSLSPPARYFVGVIPVVILYSVTGGNALLLPAMILIFELTRADRSSERQPAKWSKYVYLLLLAAVSALLPWFARYAVYTVSLREAYFALTPANFLFPTIVNKALWISFPVLYLVWRLVAAKAGKWNFTPWKVIVPNCLAVAFMSACGAYSIHDHRSEMLHRMNFELQRNNWDAVTALSKDYPTKNRLVCYYTNIALAQSGQMPYSMFHYRQLGIAGLFLDWQLTYHSMWYLGEVYYRLGMIPEAEHCAFEALVSSPKEPNVPVLQRLAITCIVRRDSASACKYLGYFDRSLAYRKWARQQRAYLALAMSDTAFRIPATPIPARYDNFFINYQYPDRTLLRLLQSAPGHRMAFEYLMAYYMLQKDTERIKWCMDNFYGNFDYPNIPTHYEEALLVYQNSTQAGDEFYAQYPVSEAVRERFARYIKAFGAVQGGNKRSLEQLEKQFGNTYWYYVHFVETSTLRKKDEQNRY